MKTLSNVTAADLALLAASLDADDANDDLLGGYEAAPDAPPGDWRLVTGADDTAE